MRKGAKKTIGSKAGHKCAVAGCQNDEVVAESLEASAQEVSPPLGPHQEEVAEESQKVNVEAEIETERKNQRKPDSLTHEDHKDASPSQQQEHVANEDRKKRARRGGNRKRTANETKTAPRAKKARVTKPQEQPQYLQEKRNLQDLWKAAFPVGIEWELFDALYKDNWDFRHLEEALEEGGMLFGKKVFVFVHAEPQYVLYKGVHKVVPIPTVVAVESPCPPSDKIAIASLQSAAEEIIPMKQMKMDWVPYIPFDKREKQVDRMKFQIFITACTQRRAALRHLKEERVRNFDYCVPYLYDPFKEDVLEQSTVVHMVFPSKQPVVCEYDWAFDTLEVFVDNLIEDEELCAEQKDEFKEFVKEQVRAAKKDRREARAARMRAVEEMSEADRQAFQSIKVYKFYPQPPPDVSGLLKVLFINRYYGKAHMVL